MNTVHVFVSFSATGDVVAKACVRRLLARLADQAGLQVWIYESPQGQISSGESIAQACRQRIEACDLFLLVLTDQALASDYVAMELSHALWVRERRLSRPLRIVPLLCAKAPRADWPPQFKAAMAFRGRAFDVAQPDIESVVLDVCTAFSLDYAVPPDDDLRLPMRTRLIAELKSAHSGSAFDTFHFQGILQKCELAMASLAAGRSSRARQLAESILLDFEINYPGCRPYYARIVRATALLAEADEGLASFDAAHQAFDEIVADGGTLLDANAYAGRAHACLRLGRPVQALADYAQAERLLSCLDPALLYSQFRACILAQVPIDAQRLQLLEGLLGAGVVTQRIGDSSRVASIVCLAYAHAGDVAGVKRAWAWASDLVETDVQVVCELCHWLEERCGGSAGSDALPLCETMLLQRIAAGTRSDPFEEMALMQQHVRIEFGMGRPQAALQRALALLAQFPRHAVLALDAAVIAIEAGQFNTAARLCTQVLDLHDPADCEPRVDRASFERNAALAHWLLGQRAESLACHRRSGLPESSWCAVNMPQSFGTAHGRSVARGHGHGHGHRHHPALR